MKEKEPSFDVNNKVRVISNNRFGGQIGTVIERELRRYRAVVVWVYTVCFDSGKKRTFSEVELARVE